MNIAHPRARKRKQYTAETLMLIEMVNGFLLKYLLPVFESYQNAQLIQKVVFLPIYSMSMFRSAVYNIKAVKELKIPNIT